jgi:hypothetical protein
VTLPSPPGNADVGRRTTCKAGVFGMIVLYYLIGLVVETASVRLIQVSAAGTVSLVMASVVIHIKDSYYSKRPRHFGGCGTRASGVSRCPVRWTRLPVGKPSGCTRRTPAFNRPPVRRIAAGI